MAVNLESGWGDRKIERQILDALRSKNTGFNNFFFVVRVINERYTWISIISLEHILSIRQMKYNKMLLDNIIIK